MKKKKMIGLICFAIIMIAGIAAVFAWPTSRDVSSSTLTLSVPSEDVTICSIPTTIDGTSVYFGETGFETNVYGPTTLAVDTDGVFWITDTINRRLIKVSRGCMISTIPLRDVLVMQDVAVTSQSIFVLNEANEGLQLLRLSRNGVEIERHYLPKEFDPWTTGIHVAADGSVVGEVDGGGSYVTLANTRGEFAPGMKRDDLEAFGMKYRVVSRSTISERPGRADLYIGDRQVPILTEYEYGGVTLLGATKEHVFVGKFDMVSFPATNVDYVILMISGDGDILAKARVPLDELYFIPSHSVAFAPNGSVYAFVPLRDTLEIRRLGFKQNIEPILRDDLSATATSTSGFVSDTQSPTRTSLAFDAGSSQNATDPLTCRSRSAMMTMVTGYINNSKYLSDTNLNGYCAQRHKPSYLGGAGTYSSVSYAWGGFNTPAEFNAGMSPATYKAGDVNWYHSSVLPCVRGVDCSGFVSRIWGIATKQSTCTLLNYPYTCSCPATMQPGDAYIKCGDHAMLFNSYSSSGSWVYESVLTPGKVKLSHYPTSYFLPYTKARFCNVCS